MKKLNVLVPSVLALFVASAAHAGATFDTPQGKLMLGGDVEYNLDATHNNSDALVTDNQSANGRILVDIEGERALANGNYAAFKVNPTFDTNAVEGSGEDAWFGFGVKNDWGFKMGHYEAYDLSVAGQDTYTTGNEGYRAKLARGRASSGSQVMLSKEAGQWHAEVSTLFGSDQAYTTSSTESANLLTGAITTTTVGSYHNVSGAVQNKDPLIARPVIAWTGDTVTVAVGGEFNLVSDAYTQGVDGANLSDWSGYGATTTVKVNDDLSLNLRGAYLNDVAGSSYSVGPGAQYQNFYVAYLYSKNTTDTDAALGTTDSHTKMNEVYASYKIPGVMGLDNFDMYLGASYGTTKVDSADTVKDYGGRVRFKYFF
ncbi:carbohydrate porin [uncultured Tolumonas sp.]|uniref:carbohydrate porin n=1 Tax=uncultured Tolumonas sp. TaxID=263765 RepID=UPI002A0A9CE5|nr:carbohydrate porin [uncultured Tolumonas sp.]